MARCWILKFVTYKSKDIAICKKRDRYRISLYGFVIQDFHIEITKSLYFIELDLKLFIAIAPAL